MPRIEPKTEAFTRIWGKASPAERSVLGEMHQHYEREVKRLHDEGNEPQNIAHAIHGLVDDAMRSTIAQSSHSVSCSKGCSACCRLYVNITHEEAVLLLGHAANEDIPIDWDKLRRQARVSFPQWSTLKASDRRCVFLGEAGACTVYEHRPNSCRKYLVVGPPAHCDTVRHPGHQVAMLASPVGEAIASATLCVEKSGSMARMLLGAKP